MARSTTASTQAWTDAAYARFQSGGLSAVRVEVVARDLGATKGSFYWHFGNRQELVAAVIRRWEAEQTDAVIRAADAGGDARGRLSALFTAVAASAPHRGGEARLYVEASAEGVGDAVLRVSRRRIDYLTGLLVQMGFDESEAARRATIALAAVIGLQQLAVAEGSSPREFGDAALTATALAMTVSRDGPTSRLA